MFVHEALRLRLLADATVIAITTRIYPGFLSQGSAFPAVAYRLVEKDTVEKLEERGQSGLASHRIRFFSTCDQANGGFDTAKELDEAIRLSLQGFKGTVTDSAESIEIDGIFHRNSFDGYDDETQTYQVISDYDVWAEETKPS